MLKVMYWIEKQIDCSYKLRIKRNTSQVLYFFRIFIKKVLTYMAFSV